MLPMHEEEREEGQLALMVYTATHPAAPAEGKRYTGVRGGGFCGGWQAILADFPDTEGEAIAREVRSLEARTVFHDKRECDFVVTSGG